MSITLSKDDRAQAVASIERWFREYMEQSIGNVTAGEFLDFLLEDMGPVIYNQGVADAQARMQERVAELDAEVQQEPFAYWRRIDKGRRR